MFLISTQPDSGDQASLKHWLREYKNMEGPASILEMREIGPPSA